MRRAVRRSVILLCAVMPLAGTAEAKLSVCNKSAKPATVALGRFNGAGWMSQGWWTVAPKSCSVLIEPALVARYYYLYASDGGAGSWSGSRSFCVSRDQNFVISGRSDCAARGFDQKSFFEVDTGAKPDWTQNLSD